MPAQVCGAALSAAGELAKQTFKCMPPLDRFFNAHDKRGDGGAKPQIARKQAEVADCQKQSDGHPEESKSKLIESSQPEVTEPASEDCITKLNAEKPQDDLIC